MQRHFRGCLLFAPLAFLFLATLLLSKPACAAGLDFTMAFAYNGAPNQYVSNRLFNTMTGAADGNRFFVGPRLVPTGVANSYFGISSGQISRYDGITGAVTLETSPGIDLNDWPMGVAYDTTQNRAVLVTLGAEGFLYQRPVTADHWSTISSMHNEDLEDLVYFPPENAFYGLRVFYGDSASSAHLLKYSAAGVQLDGIVLPPFPVNIMPGDHTAQLAAVGTNIVMLVERAFNTPLQATDKSRIYVINPVARTIELTYESASPVPPEVYFTSPGDSTNTLGSSFNFRLIAKDANKDIRTIIVRDNDATVRQWTLDAGQGETNVFEFSYAPTSIGAHTISVLAVDVHGLSSQSSVHITVLAPNPPPALFMTAPLENAQFVAPTNVMLSARGTNGSFSFVNFYVDSTKLPDVHSVTLEIPQSFSFIWSNATVGEHGVKVVGVTPTGFRATSAPVHIKVVSNLVASITVTRDLPDFYRPGEKISVSLGVRPNAAVNAWAIEETPPSDWTISEINFDGIYDAVTKKLKWGPFTEHTNVTLSYKTLPPATASGTKTFAGVASANGRTFEIGGDTTIVRGTLYHPADISPQDSRMTVNEVTGYAAAWKSGAHWNYEPIQIPIDYVTRAGYLWRSGETYTFNAAFQPPNCWVPTNNLLKGLALELDRTNALRIVSPPSGASRAVTVTLRFRPAANVTTYACEEMIPPTWRLSSAGGGTLAQGVLRFGPYFDSQPRDFTYSVVPTTNSIIGNFTGNASFDGSMEMVQGGQIVFLSAPKIERRSDGKLHLQVNAAPGEQFTLESAESIDGPWQSVAQITGGELPVELPDFDSPTPHLFYRLVPGP